MDKNDLSQNMLVFETSKDIIALVKLIKKCISDTNKYCGDLASSLDAEGIKIVNDIIDKQIQTKTDATKCKLYTDLNNASARYSRCYRDPNTTKQEMWHADEIYGIAYDNAEVALLSEDQEILKKLKNRLTYVKKCLKINNLKIDSSLLKYNNLEDQLKNLDESTLDHLKKEIATLRHVKEQLDDAKWSADAVIAQIDYNYNILLTDPTDKDIVRDIIAKALQSRFPRSNKPIDIDPVIQATVHPESQETSRKTTKR